MAAFFLLLALVGGLLVVLQFVLGLAGLDHHGADLHGAGHLDDGHGDGAALGLQLFTLRGIAAGLAFFGLTGWGLLRAGTAAWLALPAALVAGAVALVAVALALRAMLRFEADGTARIEGAVGQPATVYIPIPADGAGVGKVQLMLQNRTVEYEALTRLAAALPTGASVTVVGVVAPGVVEVVATPTESELLDA